jgi:hypothetical protein
MKRAMHAAAVAAALAAAAGTLRAQDIKAEPVDRWVTVTGAVAGGGERAVKEAVAQALRKAVEQACGVFLTAESKTKNYQLIYDKIFADAVGYVREHEVLKTWGEEGKTFAKVRARVSTQKFEKDWAVIAHTVEQENNPRLMVAIVEAVRHTATGPVWEVDRQGIVQGQVEDFFLSKGLSLVDRSTAGKTKRRDVRLAAVKGDRKVLAALGARFKAEAIVVGSATAKYGKSIRVGEAVMHQYVATLNVRVIQTDSARVLASKTYGPNTYKTFQRGGGGAKALAKLGKEASGKLLAAVVEAWRRRANVRRTISLTVSGMTYKGWKVFRDEVAELGGVQALRLREIVDGVAHIDIEYAYDNESLADHLIELKRTGLDVTEITANRLKLKVIERE